MLQTYLKQIVEELQTTLSQISEEKGERIAAAILKADRIFIAGVGKSGLAVRGFAIRLTHLGLKVHVVGDTTTPNITPSDLLFIGSGSGATASVRSVTEKAKELGSSIVLITILEKSPIAQMADIALTIPAPSPKIIQETGLHSIQPMGALFEQCLVIVLDALTMVLMEKMNVDSKTMFSRHANLE